MYIQYIKLYKTVFYCLQVENRNDRLDNFQPKPIVFNALVLFSQ